MSDDLRTTIARAIHDGPNAQSQYDEALIPRHGFDDCEWSEQYFADADAVIVALDEWITREEREAMESGDYEPPTPEEREELDRLGSSNV